MILVTKKQLRERVDSLEQSLFEALKVNKELEYRLQFKEEEVKIKDEQLDKAQKEFAELIERLSVYEKMDAEEVELRNKIVKAQLQNELQTLNIEARKEVEDAFGDKPGRA